LTNSSEGRCFCTSLKPITVKFCDVTQFYSPFSGGVKRYLHEKIDYIQRATSHEHVLIVPGAKTACVKTGRSRLYTIKSPLVSRTGRYRVLVNLRALKRILEREQPDLIESGDPYQIGWKAITTGKVLRVPVIGFYHSHFAEAHVRSAARLLGRRARETLMEFAQRYVRKLYNSFAATLVPSQSLAAVLREWGIENARVVNLGVNTDIFSLTPDDRATTRKRFGIDESRQLLLYVGRLGIEKNTKLLVRAFQILHASEPDAFHLLVIGDGTQRKQLRELQEYHRNVTWRRYCSDPAELARYYRAADLFVHPGTQETFGLVALESQACGTPVVGIRGSCMDEVIAHDQTWWAAEETAESLAAAISAVSRRDLRQIGRDASAVIATEFSWAHVFQRLFYIYEEVCSKYGKQNGTEGSATAVHDSPVPPI
jgi:alpha-1,6-mannosyltransferase